MVGKLQEIDVSISQKLLIDEKQKTLRFFASLFAHSGDSWFILPALFIIWLASDGLAHRYSALFAGAVVVQASFVILIKQIIKRSRPEGRWGSVYRNSDPHSFPSGHAVRVAMITLIAWGLDLSVLKWIFTIWVPLVSFSRVMLGVHYFLDVAAGWVLGFILAGIVLNAQAFFYQLFPFIF